MNRLLILPFATGILLAFGQFFMKRLAAALPTPTAIWPLVHALLLSPNLYLFLALNVLATITYVATLRHMSMTNSFALVFVTMGMTVLLLDLFVNRVGFSPTNLIGVALGVTAVVLIAAR
jgi:hypothetical protein